MVGPGRIEFKPTRSGLAFYVLFLLLGLPFAGVGGYRLSRGTQPIVFEKARGVFWKGRKSLDEAIDNKADGQFVRLDDVHALQLIAEYVGGKNAYYSYELNLVLRNGERRNVVDQANGDTLRKEAETLAAFLGKPLWDATNVNFKA